MADSSLFLWEMSLPRFVWLLCGGKIASRSPALNQRGSHKGFCWRCCFCHSVEINSRVKHTQKSCANVCLWNPSSAGQYKEKKPRKKQKTTTGPCFSSGCISGHRRRRSPPHDNIFRSLSPPGPTTTATTTTAVRESRGRTDFRSGGEEREKIAFLSFVRLGFSFGQKRSNPPEGGEKCFFPTSFFNPRPAPLKYFVACKARLI